jgi:hypothetical protein
MKNQYFADQRDFLKYDLLVELAENTPGVCRLTSIPMLTPNDDTGEGDVLAYSEGNRRSDIFHFLRYCLARGDRNIRNLRTLFQGRHYAYCCHRDDVPYSYESRQEYFTSVPTHWLQNAAVFIDPDTGIETGSISYMQGKGVNRYLFWDDIIQLFQRMNSESVLVLYQHLQRNADLVVQNMRDKSIALCGHVDVPSVSVLDDGDVAYLITSKSPSTMAHIAQSLPAYATRHGLRYHFVANDTRPEVEARA